MLSKFEKAVLITEWIEFDKFIDVNTRIFSPARYMVKAHESVMNVLEIDFDYEKFSIDYCNEISDYETIALTKTEYRHKVLQLVLDKWDDYKKIPF